MKTTFNAMNTEINKSRFFFFSFKELIFLFVYSGRPDYVAF